MLFNVTDDSDIKVLEEDVDGDRDVELFMCAKRTLLREQ